MATNVLVVDDSSTSRKMLMKALPSQWDISVTQAANGQEALDLYRTGKVDVMFLDLTMPVMDGFQLLEHLQKEGLNCIVFVVSADVQPLAIERAKKLGAAEFIPKPVTSDKIIELLGRFGLQ
ncbi:MAG: response regulator [Gammaproteobacteria bacterium]|nr:response regulator [Gammaproteobacteria bacterium]